MIVTIAGTTFEDPGLARIRGVGVSGVVGVHDLHKRLEPFDLLV
jgi:hypothetical protein